MAKYFARDRQEGDITVTAANGPIFFLKDGTNQTLALDVWNNLVVPDFFVVVDAGLILLQFEQVLSTPLQSALLLLSF